MGALERMSAVCEVRDWGLALVWCLDIWLASGGGPLGFVSHRRGFGHCALGYIVGATSCYQYLNQSSLLSSLSPLSVNPSIDVFLGWIWYWAGKDCYVW